MTTIKELENRIDKLEKELRKEIRKTKKKAISVSTIHHSAILKPEISK